MHTSTEHPQKIMLDAGRLSELNSQGYAGKFCLGDTVVLACGGWEGGPRYIHERDTVFDKTTRSYIERKCYAARKMTH